MSMPNRGYATCLALLLLSSPTNVPASAAEAVPTNPPVALDWLAGDWCGQQGQAQIEEHWFARGGVLLNVSTTTRGGKLLGFEYTRIERRGEGWVYIAQPGGVAPTEFAQSAAAGQRIDFSNPAHDYPQRVSYWHDDRGLHAEIAGPGKDGEQRFAFNYTACPTH